MQTGVLPCLIATLVHAIAVNVVPHVTRAYVIPSPVEDSFWETIRDNVQFKAMLQKRLEARECPREQCFYPERS